jgi:trigger factor
MEVLNDAVNETFVSLVQQENLRVAGYPQIEPRQDSTDQTKLEYTATFEVYPDVVIGDLSGIRIEKPIAEVTPADVERTIDILRKQKVSFEPVTRPAGKGDRVIVDFTGTIDGVEFPGGQAKDLAITVGEGRMLPEFEAALAGVVAGDNKAFELTVPQDYQGKEVAGKTAVFSMNVKSVAEPNLPLDAAFARGCGVADGNLDKLHEEIGANLKLARAASSRACATGDGRAAQEHPGSWSRRRWWKWTSSARAAGRRRAEVARRRTGDRSSCPEMFREAAASRVALGLLIGELVRQNGLDAKPEQVRALVEESAQSYEQPDEVVKWHFQDRTRLGDFEAQALEQNVIDWVLARCQVAELQTTFAELTGVAG